MLLTLIAEYKSEALYGYSDFLNNRTQIINKLMRRSNLSAPAVIAVIGVLGIVSRKL